MTNDKAVHEGDGFIVEVIVGENRQELFVDVGKVIKIWRLS